MSLKDFRQDRAIHEAQSEVRRTQTKTDDLTLVVNSLEKKLDLLTIKCEALWELIRENTSLSDEDIKDKIQQLEVRYEVINGKIRKKCEKCLQCNRPINRNAKKCLYCGAEFKKSEIFV